MSPSYFMLLDAHKNFLSASISIWPFAKDGLVKYYVTRILHFSRHTYVNMSLVPVRVWDSYWVWSIKFGYFDHNPWTNLTKNERLNFSCWLLVPSVYNLRNSQNERLNYCPLSVTYKFPQIISHNFGYFYRSIFRILNYF